MNAVERVAVMGAGPGGLAAAAVVASKGAHVSLYNRSFDRMESVRQRGGIEIEGDLGENFIQIPSITTDAEAAVKDAQLILIVVPAYGQVKMLETALPYLHPGQAILLLCGSAGSLEAGLRLRQAGFSLDDVLIGETNTLPQSARLVGESKIRIRIRLPGRIRTAAFPGRNTQEMVAAIGETMRLNPKPNVLDPGLNNPNFLVHPAPMLLNYAAIERAEGMLSLMNEGMTDGVLRLLDAVDNERTSLQRVLGLDILPVDDLYREQGSGPQVYREKGEPFNLRDRIWPRYIDEDVPYGSVLLSSLGKMLGVPTPICDGINACLSVVEQTNFVATGRTVEKLGIDGLDRDALLHYLDTGERADRPV